MQTSASQSFQFVVTQKVSDRCLYKLAESCDVAYGTCVPNLRKIGSVERKLSPKYWFWLFFGSFLAPFVLALNERNVLYCTSRLLLHFKCITCATEL